jgi:hypothetical protein
MRGLERLLKDSRALLGELVFSHGGYARSYLCDKSLTL